MHDEKQTSPKGLFTSIFHKVGPCLILIDELADYCCAASGVTVGTGSLADQTITFVQELLDAVKETPGVVCVITLPASPLEVANSQLGQAVLSSLEKRVGRMAADLKPVGDDEIYEVVRKRLFDSVGSKEDREQVVSEYFSMYKNHKEEIPSDVTKEEYKQKMLRSYPFHPQLIDIFYTRWGSHPDFQRTRGILRLLATSIADLWSRKNTTTQTQPLIQPAHLRFDIDPLIGQITKIWGVNYQAVAASDIVGQTSNAVKIDNERAGDYAKESLVQGVAASIFLGSFGGNLENAGLNAGEIKVAVNRPGVNWNYTDGAINALDERAFYLHSTSVQTIGKRYWFTAKPTFNKLVVQYRQSIDQPSLQREIVELLRKSTGGGSGAFRVIVDPPSEFPEQKSLTLVVLPPTNIWTEQTRQLFETKVREYSKRCGSKERIFRNTLLFLVPLDKGFSKLENDVRDLLAYRKIQDDYGQQLDQKETEDLRNRIRSSEISTEGSIGTAYCLVLRVFGPQDEVKSLIVPNGHGNFKDHLSHVWQQLAEEDWIISGVGSLVLKEAGLWPDENHIVSVKEATEAFLRFTDKHMLSDEQAIVRGITKMCKEGLLGVGFGTDSSSIVKRVIMEEPEIDSFQDSAYLIPPFERNTELHGEAGENIPPAENGAGTNKIEPLPISSGYKFTKIYGSVPLDQWSELFRSFISPLRTHISNIEISIEAKSSNGEIDSRTVGNVEESAKQLGMKFESKKADE
jgi:hypothetical protein